MPETQLQQHESGAPGTEDRPRFGIGHVTISADDVDRLTAFYTGIGMRPVANLGRFAIVELRGGTHLIVQQGAPGVSTLDLIVDDVDEVRQVLATAGANPTPIERGSPHDRFVATDPEGNTLLVYSDHSIGPV